MPRRTHGPRGLHAAGRLGLNLCPQCRRCPRSPAAAARSPRGARILRAAPAWGPRQGGKLTVIDVSKRFCFFWHHARLDSQLFKFKIAVAVLQRLEIAGRPSWTPAPPGRCAPPAPPPRPEMRRRPPVSPGIQRSAVRRPLAQVRAWNRAAPFLGLARPGQDPMPPTGPRGSSLGASRIPTLTAHIARRLGCGGSLSGAARRETCVAGNWAGAQMRAGGGAPDCWVAGRAGAGPARRDWAGGGARAAARPVHPPGRSAAPSLGPGGGRRRRGEPAAG